MRLEHSHCILHSSVRDNQSQNKFLKCINWLINHYSETEIIHPVAFKVIAQMPKHMSIPVIFVDWELDWKMDCSSESRHLKIIY